MARRIEEVHDEILRGERVSRDFRLPILPINGGSVSTGRHAWANPRYAQAELEDLSEWAVANRELGKRAGRIAGERDREN